MKKIIILSISFLSIVGIANADTIGSGSWLMTKTIENNKSKEVYTLIDFQKNGKVVMMGVDTGTWVYNTKNKSFEIISTQFKKLNGTRRAIKINDYEMILEKDGVQWIFEKINKEKIFKKNLNSGLIGSWRIINNNHSDSYQSITFNTPDCFTMLEKGNGFESKSSGTWIFNKKKKSLIIISLGSNINIRGKNKVTIVNDNEIELQKNGLILKVKKIIQNAKNIEHLSFSEENFYTENGDYKYPDDDQKLPWQDIYEMINYLKKVKHLAYNYKILVESTKSFETKTLTADVSANEKDESLSIDYIFNGYDRYNLPEDTELLPNNFDTYAILFPYKGDTFRVTGTQEITTSAGTFNCTIVETINTSDVRAKLWMSEDNPGIIIKIIQDKPGSFGYYYVYELKEIK